MICSFIIQTLKAQFYLTRLSSTSETKLLAEKKKINKNLGDKYNGNVKEKLPLQGFSQVRVSSMGTVCSVSRMMAALLSSLPVTLYFYRVKLYN